MNGTSGKHLLIKLAKDLKDHPNNITGSEYQKERLKSCEDVRSGKLNDLQEGYDDNRKYAARSRISKSGRTPPKSTYVLAQQDWGDVQISFPGGDIGLPLGMFDAVESRKISCHSPKFRNSWMPSM
jgi:hypothetical protein